MARTLFRVEPYIEMTFKFCTDPRTDTRRLLPPLNAIQNFIFIFFKGPSVYVDNLDFNVKCYCGGMGCFL